MLAPPGCAALKLLRNRLMTRDALAADARKLPGVCPPLGFFDPLGLCFTTASEVKRMREAEARVNSSAARSRL